MNVGNDILINNPFSLFNKMSSKKLCALLFSAVLLMIIPSSADGAFTYESCMPQNAKTKMMKNSDDTGRIYCVTLETAEKLKERGWGTANEKYYFVWVLIQSHVPGHETDNYADYKEVFIDDRTKEWIKQCEKFEVEKLENWKQYDKGEIEMKDLNITQVSCILDFYDNYVMMLSTGRSIYSISDELHPHDWNFSYYKIINGTKIFEY